MYRSPPTGSISDARRGAFTLIELLVVIAVIALLIGILLPAIARARETTKRLVCLSNFRQYAVAAATYEADYADALPAYSWRGGEIQNTEYSDLRTASSDKVAVMHQAVSIFREQLGDDSIGPFNGWLPMQWYSHLPMLDYIGTSIFDEEVTLCPSDVNRIELRQLPEQPFNRNRFQTSFDVVPASYSPDQTGNGRSALSQFPSSSGGSYAILALPGSFGNGRFLETRRSFQVQFPAQKVRAFDTHQRHFGRDYIYHAIPVEQHQRDLGFGD
ncbi:MAG: type II secretion system protein, partial [Planctomycetota bacterium]